MVYDNELRHFGIKGMKWGIRRYQNSDGSLTDAGKKRYSNVDTIRSKKTGENFTLPRGETDDPMILHICLMS